MPAPSNFQDWLDVHLLDDSHYARAYEQIGARARSTLKLCIARLHAYWGELAEDEYRCRTYTQGFRASTRSLPASACLILSQIGPGYPAKLLAACLPALLARVRPVFSFLATTPEDLAAGDGLASLAAMELAGIDQSAAAPPDTIKDALPLFASEYPTGRVVVIGEKSFCEPFLLEAFRLALPCAVFPDGPLDHNLTGPVGQSGPGAQVHESRPGSESGSFLELDEDHRDLWIWPNLGPEWFRNTSISVSRDL